MLPHKFVPDHDVPVLEGIMFGRNMFLNMYHGHAVLRPIKQCFDRRKDLFLSPVLYTKATVFFKLQAKRRGQGETGSRCAARGGVRRGNSCVKT